ncbi:ROK family protein [Clostridium sp.]|jgi:predicted NBD/HSP70 family sugar kinase|uniref:ROK family protein n=1 Tax=Clostridium sp. TaxID=1506 RepID=UPI0025C05544|nr:ROK family protein [Clostridium sp.]
MKENKIIDKYIALDVGGSAIKYGLLNKYGEILEKGNIVTDNEDIDKFIFDIKIIVEKYIKSENIKGLACSFPGAVNQKTGFIEGVSAVPCIHNVNMKKLLSEATALEISMENDANCSALAEGWIGAAKDVDNFISIVLGTGIGGAVVIDKKILRGKNLHGGEFGFIQVTDEKGENGLGNVWSRVASTGALIRRVANRKNIDVSDLTGQLVFEMEKDDEEVKEEFAEWFKVLAKGIYNIQYILDPEKILIGGGISARKDFIDRLNQYLELMKNKESTLDIKVEKCEFDNDANLIGALYNFLYCK